MNISAMRAPNCGSIWLNDKCEKKDSKKNKDKERKLQAVHHQKHTHTHNQIYYTQHILNPDSSLQLSCKKILAMINKRNKTEITNSMSMKLPTLVKQNAWK